MLYEATFYIAKLLKPMGKICVRLLLLGALRLLFIPQSFAPYGHRILRCDTLQPLGIDHTRSQSPGGWM